MAGIRIGRKCDAYHDGKCSPSRLAVVVIDDVLERGRLNKKALRLWGRCIREDFANLLDGTIHYSAGPQQFWDWNCQEFVVAHIPDDPDSEREPMLFARRPSGDWYGVNCNYLLDIGGRIRRRYLGTWREAAKSQGLVMKWNRGTGMYDFYDGKTGKKA